MVSIIVKYALSHRNQKDCIVSIYIKYFDIYFIQSYIYTCSG